MKRELAVVGAAVAAIVALVGSGRPVEAKATFLKKAQAVDPTIKDCLACHTQKSGRILNPRGQFLADKKRELDAKEIDFNWLKEYKPADAAPAANAPTPAPTEAPATDAPPQK